MNTESRRSRAAHRSIRGSNLATSTMPSWIAGLISLTLIALHTTGWFGPTMYTIAIGVASIAGIAGLAIHRPDPMWPWILLLSSGLLWMVGGELAAVDNFGNLTDSRSLTSDLFGLPGYIAFAGGIGGLLRARRRGRDLTLLLDSIILAFGAGLVVHHTLIEPTLSLDSAWPAARLVVAAYPALALVLLGITTQLAFAGGKRTVPFVYILCSNAAMFVGDMGWALGETGRLGFDTSVLAIPYLLVPSALGVAMLHPAVSEIGSPEHDDRATKPVARYLAVSSALIAPSALVVFPGSITPLAIGLSIGLCMSAAVRVAVAMRAEDTSRATLLYQATHDDLTDLPSRPLLLEEIDRRLQLEGGESVALLFIDLDRFKNVNDLMGHQAGDELLMAVAERIVETVRGEDLVARISGDEFVVVTGGLTVEGARRIANRVRSSLTQPFELGVGEVIVTASVGVSRALPLSGKDAAGLLQEADTAMYESKIGRNDTTVFDATMQERATRKMEIERLLRHATDSPELTAFYQPIIDAERNAVVGFEALLRWTAMGGPVSPDEFIPIAEDSGLIVPIGAFVLDEACRQAAYWRANLPGGEDLYVSVNLSARQVISPDIVDTVDEALQRHQLPASALWLEITETVMTEDTAITAAAMTGLRALGVRIALDDFGTGYSSLSGLQYLPVSRLKIDRKFIMGLGSNPANDKLVRCITAVAESFGLDVVAEGVETRDHLSILKTMDCSLIQGWLYSPAVAAEDVPAVFAEHHREIVRRHRPTALHR